MAGAIRTAFMLWLAAAVCVPSAASRTPEKRNPAQGFVFLSLDKPSGGGFSDAMTGGAGFEAFFYRGLGMGVDLGYQFPRREAGSGVGLASVNGCYHFADDRLAGGRFVPFVTGGYGLAFRSGHLNFFNFGGGATYWFHRHFGARVELRDYRHTRYGDYAATLRFGLSLR